MPFKSKVTSLGGCCLKARVAGPAPTASAVLADVLELARHYVDADRTPAAPTTLIPAGVLPPVGHRSRHYFRVTVPDRAGVLAQVAGALGDRDVSIASMIQSEADAMVGTAELVFTTHDAADDALRAALDQLVAVGVAQRVGNILPIAGAGSAR